MKTYIIKLSVYLFSVIFLFGTIGKIYADNNESDSLADKVKSNLKIYKFDIKEEIAPAAWRQTQAAFDQANDLKADYILLHLNTFGGALDAADKIRTKILESPIPVMVFIDNNAASAGALISIACDSIYMKPGANIGAATVVDQAGVPLPEKYQSYMRSILRSTAEASGRDPQIAEAMNDPRIVIENINDSGKVLTFTTTEAIKYGYCEGMANSVEDLLEIAGLKDYTLIEYTETTVESIIDFLLNPVLSSVLIMIIIGGIYFELQTPGVGFPIIASIIAALLYFAPHYLQGLASNWEIVLFAIGVVLVIVELFVIPGFGFIGITGVVLIVLGLALSLVGSIPSESPIDLPSGSNFIKALFTVVVSIVIALLASFYFGGKLINSGFLGKIVLSATQESKKGFVSTDISEHLLVGKRGLAYTVLRPAGKVEIDGDIFDATAEMGFIEKGENIVVMKYETAQLFVRKSKS